MFKNENETPNTPSSNLQEDTSQLDQTDTDKPKINKSSATFKFNIIYRVIRAVVIFLIFIILAGGALGLGVGLGYFSALTNQLEIPDKETLRSKIHELEQQSKITYSNDELISVIKSDLVRTPVSEKEISPLIKQALISTEDENFYEHHGVVPKAVARATFSDITGFGSGSGGSTITQQVIKQQLLTNETSYKRKASEMILATEVEKYMTKTEILTAYLNVSPFGRNNKGENIAGIEEAALGIFGVHAKDVNLAQAAYLAGLPQSPIYYSPYTGDATIKEDVSAGIKRKNIVLFNMYREKMINQKEYEDAVNYDLTKDFIRPEAPSFTDSGFLYNYLYDEAARLMMPTYYEKDKVTEKQINESPEIFNKYFELAKREIRQNGLTIHSTIDQSVHTHMQEAVQQYGRVLDDGRGKLLETGSVLMDNKTGRVYGFIGGRDYNQNQNNHAFQTRRSPGSTMKPILAYAPAIDKGIIGSESQLADFPMKYRDNNDEVKNYSDFGSKSFKSVRESLKWSLNIPVVNLYDTMLTSNANPKEYFEKMNIGLNPEEYTRESIALGGTDHGLTVYEETSAYATLANRGTYNEGYTIDKITDASGKVVYEHKANPINVFKPSTATIMNDMMRDVINSGTGQEAKNVLNRANPTLAKADWVGKTGTSQDQKDYWFTASTPAITMSSWIGYDDNTLMYDTWNKKNMEYWALMTAYVYQRNPEIFGTNDKFSLDPSVKKEKVASFTGQKPDTIRINDLGTFNLKDSKQIDSLYSANNGPKDSEFRFGIGGTDDNYKDAWKSFMSSPDRFDNRNNKDSKRNTNNNNFNRHSSNSR
ncbi:transglycosylase domain-containing protein [Vagococcus vulneris]|uniref:Uncharacterized protein n=1 Tax=Vagococcus vulneris TaxID=1977869 RepID=A0A429ZX53_9ENTE|nr:transglycosylase domain-containing protein [Vagococcus vulneris]RST98434.1 hypothetical protein CBF37_07935 [Vagococcus vulneris]